MRNDDKHVRAVVEHLHSIDALARQWRVDVGGAGVVGDFVPGEGVCFVGVFGARVMSGEEIAWAGNGEVRVGVEDVGRDWIG